MIKRILILGITIFFTLNVFADEYIDSALDCCSENSRKLDNLIDNQNKVLTKLNKSIKVNRDTTIALIQLREKEIKKKSCDLCGILGAALGAIISAFVSLTIYRQGERNERKEKRKEIEDFGEDIYILTNDSVRGAKIQVDAIKDYIDIVERELHKAHLLRRVPLHQLERIRSFEVDKVKKAFRQINLTNKDFVNFYNQIDYLFEVYTAMHVDYEETNAKHVTPLSNSFLKLRQEILTDITEYTEKLRKGGQSGEDIYVFLDNLLKEYLEPIQGRLVPDIKYDYDSFIYILIVELVTKYRDDELSGVIMRKLQSAKEMYISVIGASTHFVSDLKDRISDLEKSTQTLDEINNKLKENFPS